MTEDAAAHEKAESSSPLPSWFTRHVALLTSAALVAAVTLKLAIISHLDSATALALVKAAGATSVVTGTLLVGAAGLATLALSTAEWWFLYAARRGEGLLLPSVLLTVSFLLVMLLVVWYLAIVILAIVAIAVIFAGKVYRDLRAGRQVGGRARDQSDVILSEMDESEAQTAHMLAALDEEEAKRGELPPELAGIRAEVEGVRRQRERLRAELEESRAELDELLEDVDRGFTTQMTESMRAATGSRVPSIFFVLSIVFLAGSLLADDRVWLPPEAVELRGRTEPHVGYVVGEEGDYTRFLTEDERQVISFPTDAIESRTVCRLDNLTIGRGRTIIQMLFQWDVPRYRDCS